MTQFDFKAWRESQGLTQEQAGLIIGRSGTFWGDLENGKVHTHKACAVSRVIRIYSRDTERAVLLTDAEWLESAQIQRFIDKARVNSINQSQLSVFVGGGKSSLGNLRDGTNPLNTFWRMMIAGAQMYLIKNNWQIEPESDESNSVNVKSESVNPESESVNAVTLSLSEPQSFERVQPIMIDGQPWWIVADVCRAIEHTQPTKAVNLVDSDDRKKHTVDSSIGEQWVINEPGLYTLLLRSNLPKAKPFKRWVTAEVLPAIRKTGKYESAPEPVNTLDALIIGLQELKAAQAEIGQLKNQVQQIESSTNERLDNIEEMVSPEKAAEIVLNEAQWTNNAKCWVRDCADQITIELIKRGSMETRTKLYSQFWRAHNKFVGVSSHANICCVAEAQRSMVFTENYARMRAIALPPFQTAIDFNQLLQQKQGVAQ